jgi:DNA end-binding protein Ku
MLHKRDLSRLKEVFYCAKEDKPIRREDIAKGYEISKDECVPVDPAELEKIAPKSSKVMDILQFVKAEEFDPVFMDKSYQVLPDGDIAKPYALLRESMKKRKQFAIAKVAMHNRDHVERVQGGKTNQEAPQSRLNRLKWRENSPPRRRARSQLFPDRLGRVAQPGD